jgi:eukaryotic-like serine/threonine-protein kinase
VTQSGLVLDARYRLDERIAAGSVGQVWRAADLLLERPVAVKLLRPEYADHLETLERFRAEARHAGSLTHPCIAKVYDYGHAGPDGPAYLVMEFVNGPSLADVLAIEPVEPVRALDIVAQAATGLDAAHRSGLVHRDVKPANILIGPDGLVKITDFGIAHVVGSAPVTAPGLLMGTMQYIAPERINGGPSTPASDLYSLGIVIYECLTGMPPYEGTPAEVTTGHLYLPLPPLPAAVPPALEELVARLTAKDPAARIADAGELAALASGLRDVIAPGQPAGPGTIKHAGGVAADRSADRAAVGIAKSPDNRTVVPTAPLPMHARGAARTRRRRMTAVGVTVLAGAGVAASLAFGALRATPPTTDHAQPPAAHSGVAVPGAPTRGAGPSASLDTRPNGNPNPGQSATPSSSPAPSSTSTVLSQLPLPSLPLGL